jgi:hypothetical protein
MTVNKGNVSSTPVAETQGDQRLKVRQESPVPPDIRRLSPMTDPGYVDAFTLTPAVAGRSPEQWARTMFAEVAGWQGQLIWRGLLGLRLHDGPDRIAGWPVVQSDEHHVRLEARSWFLTGHLVVRVDGDCVTLATYIGYDRRLARWVWEPLSRVHRRLAPGLLVSGRRTLLEVGVRS